MIEFINLGYFIKFIMIVMPPLCTDVIVLGFVSLYAQVLW